MVEHCDSVTISLAVTCESQSAKLHREQHVVVRTPWAAEKDPSPGRGSSGKSYITSAVDLHKTQRGHRLQGFSSDAFPWAPGICRNV